MERLNRTGLVAVALAVLFVSYPANAADKEVKAMTAKKKTTRKIDLGADKVRWDLSVLYGGLDDPRIDADLSALTGQAKKFRETYKGKLDSKLGAALTDHAEISMLSNKVFGYLALMSSVRVGDDKVRGAMADAQSRWAAAAGENLTFFDLELAALSDEAIVRQAAADDIVRRHLPYLEDIRRYRTHLLSEEVETALAKRGQFGPSSWSDFYDEVEGDLWFEFGGKTLKFVEITDIIANSRSSKTRAAALKAMNDGLKGTFAKYAAQTLYMVAGSKRVEDAERRYAGPMSARNLGNKIPDASVEALHQTVQTKGAGYAKRYYRMKRALLGLKQLRWSDRNAKLGLKDGMRIPFDEALTMIIDAYRSFSPEMARLVEHVRDNGWIDAAVSPTKESGAYDMTLTLPGDKTATFVLLSYQGSVYDVMVLAHELGHAVHGLLTGSAQSPLMADYPMAYAETASVFGERLVFERLQAKLVAEGKDRALLTLLCGKIDDSVNTTVRQISFSNFERRLHAAGRRLSVEELSKIWLEVTAEMYGADREVFLYRDMDMTWSYIDHFQRPFYVYSYAFGNELVDSLYARRGDLGDRFEPLYLDLLRSGGTRDAVELLRPFGLDPTAPDFWEKGIDAGLGEIVLRAETLARKLGYKF